MNIILDIIFQFLSQHKFQLTLLFVINIFTNFIYSNGLSYLTANIINTMKEENYAITQTFFYSFIAVSILYIATSYVNEYIQNDILSTLRHWLRIQLTHTLFRNIFENFKDKNFLNMHIPISRISNVCFSAIEKLSKNFIPSITFLLVIYIYFCYIDLRMGLVFFMINIAIFVYIFTIYPVLLHKNSNFESQVIKNEGALLEMLNNADTIIYRSQLENEMNTFKEINTTTMAISKNYLNFINNQVSLLALIVYLIIFAVIFYCIQKTKRGEMSIVVFITLFTIILFYRERMIMTVYQTIEFIDFIGKYNSALSNIVDMPLNNSTATPPRVFSPATVVDGLLFDHIEFRQVSFKYDNTEGTVFDRFSFDLDFSTSPHKIIGITGNSGKGKSTLIKLLLKMYPNYQGDVFIDGKNIRDIDTDYLRKNIIYINQNSKLFDRKIIENMLYGCPRKEGGVGGTECQETLERILKEYSAIRMLFKDNNIYEQNTGSLGEKMSGGQKNVISIISGLVNHSVGLILDEPTNGMDKELKTDIIRLIDEFKSKKKFIVIITHDRDVYRIMDERREM